MSSGAAALWYYWPEPLRYGIIPGFKHTYIAVVGKTVPAGARVVLSQGYVKGFLINAYLRLSGTPNFRLVLDMYGDGTYDVTIDLKRLYDENFLDTEADCFAKIRLWDTTNNVYVATLACSPPIPWEGEYILYAENYDATGAAALVEYFRANLYASRVVLRG